MTAGDRIVQPGEETGDGGAVADLGVSCALKLGLVLDRFGENAGLRILDEPGAGGCEPLR